MKNQPISTWTQKGPGAVPGTPTHNLIQDPGAPGWNRFSATCLQLVHNLKERVTAELNVKFGWHLDSDTIRQAVNEADALAASTPFPTLFLPDLAEEKARAAAQWRVRQSAIRRRSLAFAA